MIEILKYIILGVIQGVCEILPVSSSAHLIIVSEILNINDESITFEIFLHIASLLAIIVYMRKDLTNLISNNYKYLFKKNKEYKRDFNLIIKLIISCIPICIITLIFNNLIDYINNTIWLIGLLLMINGVLIYKLTKINRLRCEVTFKDALVIGLFQSLACVPGLSRSGMCISGGISSGLKKDKTAEYSFILFIPIIMLAIIKELIFGFRLDLSKLYLYIISFIISFIFTYLSLKFLKRIIKNNKFSLFGIYTFILGLITCVVYLK